jgi:hypothetical protein
MAPHVLVWFKEVLGILDILVRIRIPESVPVTNGSGSGHRIQLRIRLLSSLILRIQKKIICFTFFSHNLPTGTSSCVKMLFCRHFFQSAQHIYEKREGSGVGSAPLTNESGSGRPKNMRILRIRIRFRIRIPNTGVKDK